jgi:hypothetical protein
LFRAFKIFEELTFPIAQFCLCRFVASFVKFKLTLQGPNSFLKVIVFGEQEILSAVHLSQLVDELDDLGLQSFDGGRVVVRAVVRI